MVFFRYSGDEFDLHGDLPPKPTNDREGYWPAPQAQGSIRGTVQVPGSKSLTNRQLVLSALADSPSVLHGSLFARDTLLMRDALTELGAQISTDENIPTVNNPDVIITPVQELLGGVSVSCGLAGTVMRFVPAVAALATGPVTFDGDDAARKRPMRGMLQALRELGVRISDDGRGCLPFTVHGVGAVEGGSVEIDAAASSQFVSGLLIAAPRFKNGLTLTHSGPSLPSIPHIKMTLASLRERGVDASALSDHSWRVEPGPIAGGEFIVEPDLSNAAPFLLSPVVTGGEVQIPNWPASTTQVGDFMRELLPHFGARVSVENGMLSCSVSRGILSGYRPDGFELDLSAAGELAPNIAGVMALCKGESRLIGIGHLRGHETDRLAALATELNRVGAQVEQTDDGLVIRPGKLHPALWQCYGDHRMATTGALIGLAVAGIQLDDVACTDKTIPDFPSMWMKLVSNNASETNTNLKLDSFLEL